MVEPRATHHFGPAFPQDRRLQLAHCSQSAGGMLPGLIGFPECAGQEPIYLKERLNSDGLVEPDASIAHFARVPEKTPPTIIHRHSPNIVSGQSEYTSEIALAQKAYNM